MTKLVTISEDLLLDLLNSKYPGDNFYTDVRIEKILTDAKNFKHPDTERLEKLAENQIGLGWSKFIVQAIKKENYQAIYHSKPEQGPVDSVEVIADKAEALRKVIDTWSK